MSSSPATTARISLALVVPILLLPVLALLYSLTLHLLIIYRKLQGEDHTRLSRVVRAAGLVQVLLTFFPLITFSLVMVLKATIGPDLVDMSDMHRHLFSHSLQGLTATVSFVNLVISAVRFNERDTGRAVSLLVGVPFLLTNIGFRLIGFSLLFCYFQTVWIFLCLCLLFCISAISVQLTARESLCVRLAKSSPTNNAGKDTMMDGVAGMTLMSVANVFVPCGYNLNSRGWRLLFVCWIGNDLTYLLTLLLIIVISVLGSMCVHGFLISQTIMTYVPNTISGLAPVYMDMVFPKMAVDIPKMFGWMNIQLVLPKYSGHVQYC